ncbi:MAG: glycosyltransferase family 1 protein [Bacteroidales bacterium]|nr:glycosyltransferase family 1 protein [Bacteroidales bacterium]
MEPIRVLMLFTNMNRGGAESMVMSYYRNIDRTKVQFDFLVHRPERGAYEEEIEQLGGRIYRLIPFHPFTFGQYKKLVSQFFDDHPEYQIIHGHCSELGYFIYQEASRRGIPHIIAHAHNAHALYDMKWPFRTWFKHRMRRYLTHEFTCGQEAAVWLFGSKLAHQAVLQRNAIDTQLFRFDTENRVRIHKEFGIADDTLLIGHVGRFEKQKNHSFLIDVFEKVLTLYPQARLLLIGGTGNLEGAVRAKVKEKGLADKVIFAGTRSDVPQILSAMDVFLFPSFMEGMSLSMLEAQCAGLPCLVSDSIPKEISVTDLITYYPLKIGADDWAKRLFEVSKGKADRNNYYQKVAEAGYDIKQNAEWLQNYYLSLVE